MTLESSDACLVYKRTHPAGARALLPRVRLSGFRHPAQRTPTASDNGNGINPGVQVSVVLSGQLVRMKTEVRSGTAVELPMARLGAWEVAGEEALRGDACERTLRASELTDLLQIDTAVYSAAITADREQVSDEGKLRGVPGCVRVTSIERSAGCLQNQLVSHWTRGRGPYRS